MNAWWNYLRQVWANADWSWIVLWLGLSLLIIALIVLMRTRWGQSQPLGKCAVLSLMAHLLLAVYAMTVQIVTGSAGGPHSDPIRASLVDADEWIENASRGDRPVYDTANSTAAAAFWPTGSEPARQVNLTGELNRIENRAADRQAAEVPRPVANLTPSLPNGAAMPSLEAPAGPRQPPESIDEPKPVAAAKPADTVPEIAALDRLPTTDAALTNDSSAKRGADHAANPKGDVGISDPLSSLPSETHFSVGNDAAFRGVRSPASAAASVPPDAKVATSAASAGGSDDGVSSLLVPVKSMNHTGNDATPSIYKDRTADDRAAIARSRGGSPETEAAVQAALKWLATNQSADGRWDADRFGAGDERKVLGHDRQGAGARADTATTGLALLAFLGAGHTHWQGKYKEHVKHGLEHLLAAQAHDGNLGGDAELFAFMYSHGIATLALSEAYAMTGDKRLEESLRAAVMYTLAAQHPSTGGWRYRSNDPGDTSQLGWQLMALKSAELSGIAIPDQTRQGMARFLRSVSSGAQGGLAGYRPHERTTRPMTAEALVCRQFLGMTRDNPAANEAGDYLLGELPSAERINLYYWYYGTLAMYQLQGDHWRQWNDSLQKTLLSRQVMTGEQAGSWDPDCIWAGYGGRVYSTATAALCLEVYYRYLPLYGDFEPVAREAKRAR